MFVTRERLRCEALGGWCLNEAREIRVPTGSPDCFHLKQYCPQHQHLAHGPAQSKPATRKD